MRSPFHKIFTCVFLRTYPRETSSSGVIVLPEVTLSSRSNAARFTGWYVFCSLKYLLNPLNLGNLCTKGVCQPSKEARKEEPDLDPCPFKPLPE